MSSTGSDDALRIPIEIKTDDLEEIRELINEITDAEEGVQTLKPRRGKGTGDTSSRSAFTPSSEESGGIFGQMGGQAMPTKGRDTKSKTPFQRENEFSKLKDQVQQQEQKLGANQKAMMGLSGAAQSFDYVSTLRRFGGKGAMSSTLGAIGAIAGKAVMPLVMIGQITGIVMSMLDAALAPGGPLDRRFRRNYSKESLRLDSLADKHEITFGRRVVRVTTIDSQRGTSSQVRSNLDYVKTGVEVFDINGTFNKGMGVGTI